MERDFLTSLPSEIFINTLSRLSVRTIALSKCVSKPWLELLETDAFANSHLSKSVPSLAVLMRHRGLNGCRFFEFQNQVDLQSCDRRYNLLARIDLNHDAVILGAANGLLLLHNSGSRHQTLGMCNPITREYVDLCFTNELGISSDAQEYFAIYGFGVSKVSGQYKVVRNIPGSDCYVYTVGTGLWRRVEASSLFDHNSFDSAVFVNGNLHWLVTNSKGKPWICCFDLETECFTSLSAPPLRRSYGRGGITSLRDCLCFCDNTSEGESVIWLMKEYGVEKSWSKEFVKRKDPNLVELCYRRCYRCLDPVIGFKNGNMLVLKHEDTFLHYSNKSETSEEIRVFDRRWDEYLNARVLTLSFVSLKSLGMENVISFAGLERGNEEYNNQARDRAWAGLIDEEQDPASCCPIFKSCWWTD